MWKADLARLNEGRQGIKGNSGEFKYRKSYDDNEWMWKGLAGRHNILAIVGRVQQVMYKPMYTVGIILYCKL